MFNGFQQTGQPRATFSPSNMFSGFPERTFSANVLPLVTDGIQAWWTSQSGITLSGANVTSWVDLLGAYNLQPTSGSPTYNTGNPLYRGYPSLGFTSAQNLSAGNILNIGTNTGITIMVVVNLTSTIGFLAKAVGVSDTTGGNWSLQYFGGNVTFTFGQGGAFVRSNTPCTTPTTVVATGVLDRTNGLLWTYVNTLASSTAASTTLTNYTPTSSLGINTTTTVGATNVMEIVMYNQALTQTQVNQNVAFLRAKYGI